MHAGGGFHLQDSRRRLSPDSTDLWLQASPLHPLVPASTHFFFPLCHGGIRSFRRGLLHVFHLPRRLRIHFFHITCRNVIPFCTGTSKCFLQFRDTHFQFFTIPKSLSISLATSSKAALCLRLSSINTQRPSSFLVDDELCCGNGVLRVLSGHGGAFATAP